MSLNAYAVPATEQKQVLDFIAKLDIRAIAVQVMQELFKALAMRFSFPLPDSVKHNQPAPPPFVRQPVMNRRKR